MKIKLNVGDKTIMATLNESKASQDFLALLPLTLTLEDYAGIEKISYLPKKLSTQGAPAAGNFIPGDVAYYAPWGNLAIHHHEFGYASGLLILGAIDSNKDVLIKPGTFNVTVELVK